MSNPIHNNTHVFTDTDILNIIAHKGRFMVHWRDAKTVSNCQQLVKKGIIKRKNDKRARIQGKQVYVKAQEAS